MKTILLISIIILFVIASGIFIAVLTIKIRRKSIKKQIKSLEARLKSVTDEYSHKMNQQQKANLYARKNQIIFAIDELKKLL